MEIYLIRHTRVTLEAGTCYGWSDIDLAETFVEECATVHSKLEIPMNAAVFTSPLRRCKQLADRFTVNPILDDRLRELHFGDWELQRWDAIDHPEFALWQADYVNQPCLGGESYRDLFARCQAFWGDLIIRPDEHIVVVTHGGPIRALLSHILDLPLEKSFGLTIDYGGVTRINHHQGRSQVAYINR